MSPPKAQWTMQGERPRGAMVSPCHALHELIAPPTRRGHGGFAVEAKPPWM
jgi:hypothetical protein